MAKGSLMGIWMHGVFLSVRPVEENGLLQLEAYEVSGNLKQQINLKIPDAQIIATGPRRFARDVNGMWAVSGVAYSSDMRSASFLAILAPDGKNQVVIRTSPYVATTVTISTDGTIWTAGSEMLDGQQGDPTSDIVRRFDT